MNALRIRLLFVCAALATSACTSSTGSTSGSSTSGIAGDGGGSSSTPVACAYVATSVTSCYGDTSSTPSDECRDEPCDQVSFDSTPVSAGDCYGYTEFSGQTDLHESCDAWRASGGSSDGAGAAATDDGGAAATCIMNGDGGNTACDTCIQDHCASQLCACASDSRADDAGATGCAGYIGCVAQCLGSASNSTESSCESQCDASFSAEDSMNAKAYLTCVSSKCGSSSTCG